jgi:hypothetical protein
VESNVQRYNGYDIKTAVMKITGLKTIYKNQFVFSIIFLLLENKKRSSDLACLSLNASHCSS